MKQTIVVYDGKDADPKYLKILKKFIKWNKPHKVIDLNKLQNKKT